MFDGDERKYELWEVKFLGYLRLKKLSDTILTAVNPDAEDEVIRADAAKNADAFAELIQVLDDRSLSLVIRDAVDDGRKALAILREHYLSKGKPRVITLYTELTSLKKASEESVTDYMLRAETASTSLKSAGETISDSLLIAMIIKGLPSEQYRAFSTVVTQKDKEQSFAEFKVSLRSFEETQKLSDQGSANDDRIMEVNLGKSGKPIASKGKMLCYGCGKPGHKISECRTRNRWCEVCKSNSHNTDRCRKKNKKSMGDATKSVRNNSNNSDNMHDDHSYAFKIGVDITSSDKLNGILVDCGATTHIVHDLNRFTKFDTEFRPENHFIELADGKRSNNVALKRGDAEVDICDVDGNTHKALLKDALYVPSYKQDIFSVHAAVSRGATVSFSPDNAKLVSSDGTEFKIEQEGRLYYLNSAISSSMSKQDSKSKSLKDWHEILGHCNLKDILALENVVEGMKIIGKKEFDCGTCVEGKMTQHRNRKADRKASNILELVHCDLAGPIDPTAREGFRYALAFVDDYSGMIMIYLLVSKSETLRATEKFLADMSPHGKVKCIRSDNGTEFTSQGFQNLLIKHSIKHEKSAPYSPHQNGTVERNWRSLFDMARCLLIQSKLPKTLWTYALMTSAYIRNRCYNPRIKKTPFHAFTNHKPNINNMHIFGTICYTYVQEKKKLDARGEQGIFVGYDKGSPAYLIYFPHTQTIKRCRTVRFSDKFEIGNDAPKPTEIVNEGPLIVNMPDQNAVNDMPEQNPITENSNLIEPTTTGQNLTSEQANTTRYPRREHTKPKYLEQFVDGSEIEETELVNFTIDYCYRMSDAPKSYQEAMSSDDSSKWQIAMEEEVHALRENETYEIAQLPKGKNTVGGKWVYTIKSGPNGEEKYKARYVAKGYSQIPNIDYHETFSPTAKMTSVRMLMQLAVQYNLTIHQMDVKTAFLNAPIDCELYVEQPKGFVIKGDSGENLVLKLKKSLYGLKQSGRNWNSLLHSYLTNEGFIQSKSDNCVYIKVNNNSITILIIWVDDIMIASNSTESLTEVKKNLSDRFQMKDLGMLSWFLGIEFTCEKEVIKMSQTKYIEAVLRRFRMEDCKPRSSPCETVSLNEESETVDSRLYREIVGSLVYIMTSTRPDLCYSVTKLSQYLSAPTVVHLNTAKHVLRYLKGTADKGLVFRKSDERVSLIGYCDADWGSSEDRRSITGYGFKLNKNGPLISWKSRKQPTVALSTCEAEYMSLSSAIQEAKFLSQLLNDFLVESSNPVSLYCDNQGAIALAKNPVQHQRSKHIDIRYHFIRQEIQKGSVNVMYVTSNENVADIFTKALPGSRVKMFVPNILGS
jgi:DNA-dependent RNA polymerase auxiliary subunit epsilon